MERASVAMDGDSRTAMDGPGCKQSCPLEWVSVTQRMDNYSSTNISSNKEQNVTPANVAIISLGCPKNLVDTEVILGHLPRESYTLVSDAAEADIIIVNTCAFINDAKEESIYTILDMAEYKLSGSCSMLIVCGCLPQRYREELAGKLPEVDLFFGTSDACNIAELIQAWNAGNQHQICAVASPDNLYDHQVPRIQATPFYTAYVKIAEGCNNCCSYCIIPELRGPLRSRSMDSIVAEVRQRVAAGVKEVNLIAQDITAYGRDRRDGASLEALLRQLVQIDNLHWLRLLYAYPEGISTELIELIATEPKICPYLDLPLQHIADPVLKAMNRRLDSKASIALVERIRRRIPDITLRTTFIVGFPGETAADFACLHNFAARGLFDRVGVFCYSREEGTCAAAFSDQVPDEVKEQRQQALMTTLSEIALEKNRALIGTETEVLVDGFSEETELLLQGRSISQAPDIDGITYINAGEACVGDIVTIEISDTTEHDLIGHIKGSLDD